MDCMSTSRKAVEPNARLAEAVDKCAVCSAPMDVLPLAEGEPDPVCDLCEAKYAPALIRSVSVASSYAIGLRDGTVIEFSRATIHGRFAHLREAATTNTVLGKFKSDRGFDVRISDIMCATDTPHGA